jgi:hypothetical protein
MMRRMPCIGEDRRGERRRDLVADDEERLSAEKRVKERGEGSRGEERTHRWRSISMMTGSMRAMTSR